MRPVYVLPLLLTWAGLGVNEPILYVCGLYVIEPEMAAEEL